MSVLRGVLAVIAGFVVAMVVMMAVEFVSGHHIYPELGEAAEGLTDRKAIRQLLATARRRVWWCWRAGHWARSPVDMPPRRSQDRPDAPCVDHRRAARSPARKQPDVAAAGVVLGSLSSSSRRPGWAVARQPEDSKWFQDGTPGFGPGDHD
jgi:hypothetical protein